MTPFDPQRSAPSEDTSAKLPEPGEDRLVQELVEGGLNEAENDLREAVENEEQERALSSPDPEQNLNDIDHTETSARQRPAELDAMEIRDSP